MGTLKRFSSKAEGHALLRLIQTQGNTGEELPLAVQSDILIERDMDLSRYGVDAEVLRTPGHTSGSLSVAIKGGACDIGDLLAGMPPSNVPELPMFAEDMDAVLASLKKVLRFQIIPYFSRNPSRGTEWV